MVEPMSNGWIFLYSVSSISPNSVKLYDSSTSSLFAMSSKSRTTLYMDLSSNFVYTVSLPPIAIAACFVPVPNSELSLSNA